MHHIAHGHQGGLATVNGQVAVARRCPQYEHHLQRSLNSSVYALLLMQPKLEGRRPALGSFADEHSTKVPEKSFSCH